MKPNHLLIKSTNLVASMLTATVMSVLPTLADDNSPHWTYGGATNPTRWGILSEDFALCGIGRDQSPINIETYEAITTNHSDLAVNYDAVPLAVENNGHSIQVNYPEGSTLQIDGKAYQLLQFHFHTPSEHTVDAQASAMEMHLLHRSENGALAVVGVLIEEGMANPAMATVWEHIPEVHGSSEATGAIINAADFLPDDLAHYSYMGSLTTPPCSEGVQWIVLDNPVQAAATQIAAFESLYQVNARPVQATNGRRVEHH
jgi:carbonic anhydrase